MTAVELALEQSSAPMSAAQATKLFARAKEAELAEILEALVALGKARPGVEVGSFVR